MPLGPTPSMHQDYFVSEIGCIRVFFGTEGGSEKKERAPSVADRVRLLKVSLVFRIQERMSCTPAWNIYTRPATSGIAFLTPCPPIRQAVNAQPRSPQHYARLENVVLTFWENFQIPGLYSHCCIRNLTKNWLQVLNFESAVPKHLRHRIRPL